MPFDPYEQGAQGGGDFFDYVLDQSQGPIGAFMSATDPYAAAGGGADTGGSAWPFGGGQTGENWFDRAQASLAAGWGRPPAAGISPTAVTSPIAGGGGAVMSSANHGEVDNSSREAFIRTSYAYALEAAGGDPILANQLVATAISENGKVGTGRSLGELGYNVGGIQGVKGPAGSFWALDAGNRREFAAYNNLAEGFRAVRDLVSGGRYAGAAGTYAQTRDVDRYWADVNRAGYAEDPNWHAKVGSIRRSQVEPLTRGLASLPPPPAVANPGLPSAPPVNPDAASPYAQHATTPASDYAIAFDFDQAYSNPFNPSIPRHRGVDIVVKGAPNGGRGSRVGAFQGGVVTNVISDPNGGNGVIIRMDNGLYNYYGHFDQITAREGERVERGSPLGILGASGTEGFPHLHYEVRRQLNGDPMGQLIDPRPYLSGAR